MTDERFQAACRALASLPDGAPVAVSACLLGVPCRYDGSAKPSAAVRSLVARLRAVAVCPESAAGLPCPRPPAEARPDGTVALADGADVTDAFEAGASACLRQVCEAGASVALLKSKSPSCGVRSVYDGSFSGTLVPGEGVFAHMLRERGVRTLDELEAEEALKAGLL